jgi:hypothetical protein
MNQEVKKTILNLADKLSRYQIIDFIIYLLETTDLTMREIGELTGRSESGVFRINTGQRHAQKHRQYPVRPSRSRVGYFYPAIVLDKLNKMLSPGSV